MPGLLDWFRSAPPTFRITDWGEIPQRTLRELGLPVRYSYDPKLLSIIENHGVVGSTDSYPWTPGLSGDTYSIEKLYENTPAFKDKFPSAVALLKFLVYGE